MDIDPEIFNEFQENLKQMSDLLGRNNAAMEQYLNVMNSLDDNNDAIKQNTSANKAGSQAVKDLTDAEKQAAAAAKRLQYNLDQATSLATSSLGSFGAALLSGQEGVGKFGSSLTTAGAAASKVAENFGLVGAAIGLAIQAFTKVAADATNLLDRTVNFRNELSKTAGTIGSSLEDISKFSAAARFSGERMEILQKTTAGLGTSLASLGGIAGEGATQFMKVAALGKDADEVRKRFGMLGVSQERLLDMQAKYVEMQSRSGMAYAMQHKTMEQLQKESIAYAENLNRISTLTGQSADQQQKERDIVQDKVQEQAKTMQENFQMDALRKQGRITEAEQIQTQQKRRKEAEAQFQAFMSPEEAARNAALLRNNGAFNAFSAPEGVINPNAPQLSRDIMAGKATGYDLIASLQQGYGRTALTNQPTLQNADDATLAAIGYDAETARRMNAYLLPGQTPQSQLKAAEEAERKRANVATNPEAAGYEDFLKTQRDLQADYQSVLQKVIDVMGPMGLTTATAVLTAAAYAAATALTFLSVRSGIAGLGGGGGGRLLGNLFGKGSGAAGAAEAEAGALTLGGRLARAGPRGVVGAGLGLGADYLKESGHETAGGLADIGSYAASGAALGALIPGADLTGIPEVIGGLAGGAYGLYKNWGNLWGKTGHDQVAKVEDAKIQAAQKQGINPGETGNTQPAAPNSDAASQIQQATQDLRNTVSSMEASETDRDNTTTLAFQRLNLAVLRVVSSLSSMNEQMEEAALGPNLGDTSDNAGGGGGGGGGSGGGGGTGPNSGGSRMTQIGDQTRTGGTISWRNNNPGNIVAGAFATSMGATGYTIAKDGNKEAVFPDYETGRRAQLALLKSNSYSNLTIGQAVGKWTKNAGPNSSYAINLAKAAGVSTDTPISSLNEQQLEMLADAQQKMEGFSEGTVTKSDIGDAAKYINFGGSSGGIQNFNGLQPGVKAALVRAAQQYYQQTGKKLTLNSGARSLQDQQRLWNNRGNNPNPVAPPSPNAPHVMGSAVDIAEYNDPAALNALHSAGLYQTVRGDPVHFTLQAANGGVFSGPDSGYPALLHGTEMIVPVDNAQNRAGSKLEELNNYTKSETLKQFSKVSDSDATKQMKDLMNKTSSVSGQGGTQIYDPASDRNLRLATEDNGLLKDIRDGINKMLGLSKQEKGDKKSSKEGKTTTTNSAAEKGYFENHPMRAGPAATAIVRGIQLFGAIKSQIGKIGEKLGFSKLTAKLFGKVAAETAGKGTASAIEKAAAKFGSTKITSLAAQRAAARASTETAAQVAKRTAAIAKATRSMLGGLGAGAPAAVEKAGGGFLSRMVGGLTKSKIGGKLLGEGPAAAIGGLISGYEEYSSNKAKGDSTKVSAEKAGIVGTGATAGAIVGGVLGSALGPIGTLVGSAAGGWVGEKLGKLAADHFITDDNKKKIIAHAEKHAATKAATKSKTPELEDPRMFAISRQARPNLAVANVRLDNSSGTYAPDYITSKIHNEPAAGQNMQQHRPQEFAQQQQNNENAKHFEKLGSHVESLGHKMEQHTRAVNEGNAILRQIMHEQRN